MALKLGDLVAYLKTDNSGLNRGLAEGEAATRATGTRMSRDADDTGRRIGSGIGSGGKSGGEQVVRDATSRLRDGRGRFVSEGSRLGDGVSRGMGSAFRTAFSTAQDFFSNTARGFSTFASGAVSAAASTWQVVSVMVAVGVAAVTAAALVYVLVGALGALPGLMFGLGGIAGTLGLGFIGLSDAFKKTASSGGGAAKQAEDLTPKLRAVQQATQDLTRSERDVADAQKDAAQATRDVAAAVVEEQKRRAVLNRDLKGANLDVRDAIDEQTDSQKALADAQAKGATPDEIDDLQRAYERAQLGVENAKARVQELNEEQQKATRTGVDGSDLVVAAKDRQVLAERRVTDAIQAQQNAVQRLADAQKALAAKPAAAGGGGGAAAQVTKLAPAAAEAVRVIKSLKPAFDSLRLDVQERLFAGVGSRIRELANAWLPTLHTRLGAMADTMNGLFRTFTQTATKPRFVTDIGEALGSVDRLLDRVGGALAGPFLDAIARLARAAGPFIDALGNGLGGLIDDFAAWIKSADDSGRLESFFERAAHFLDEVFAIGRDVGSIIGSIMGALFGSADKQDPLAGFAATLHKVAEWFKDPKNAAKVQEFFEKLTVYGDRILGFLQALGPIAGPAFSLLTFLAKTSGDAIGLSSVAVAFLLDKIAWVAKAAPKAWHSLTSSFVSAKNTIVDKAQAMADWFGSLPGKITSRTRGMWDGIKNAFRSALNWVVGKWNGLRFGVPSIDVLGVHFGGQSFGVPQIPYLAKGGIVPATPGGRIVGVAEAGQAEVVAPLTDLTRMIRDAVRPQAADMQPPEVHVYIGDRELTDIVDVQITQRDRQLVRRTGPRTLAAAR